MGSAAASPPRHRSTYHGGVSERSPCEITSARPGPCSHQKSRTITRSQAASGEPLAIKDRAESPIDPPSTLRPLLPHRDSTRAPIRGHSRSVNRKGCETARHQPAPRGFKVTERHDARIGMGSLNMFRSPRRTGIPTSRRILRGALQISFSSKDWGRLALPSKKHCPRRPPPPVPATDQKYSLLHH